MSRPFGSKNKKPRVVTPELLERLRLNREKRTQNAKGQGMQIRIEPEIAARLRKAMPRPKDRREFVTKTVGAALDALEASGSVA